MRSWVKSCVVFWEWFEPVGLEVDKVFKTVNLATCSLDPCAFSLTRLARRWWLGWFWHSFLREIVVSPCLKEALVHLLLKKLSLNPTYWTIFIHYPPFPFFRNIVQKVVVQQLRKFCMRWIIWTSSKKDLAKDMKWKCHWSCFWITSVRSRMGVGLPSLFYLTS